MYGAPIEAFVSQSLVTSDLHLLRLVKGFISDVWELRKVRLYSDNPSVQQTQSQIASGELQGVTGGRM